MSNSGKGIQEKGSAPNGDSQLPAGGDRVPVAGSSPVPPLATTGRPAEQQRDTGDRARHIRFELSPKTMVALLLVVASLWLLIRLWPVFLVLVVALLVAGTLSPAVRWLEEKHVRRGFGIAIVFTVFFIVALLVAVFTIPALLSQGVALLEHEPALRARLADYLAGSDLSAPLATWLRGLKPDALRDAISSAASAYSLRVFSAVAYGFSALFLGLYIMIDRDRLRGGLFALVPRSHHIRLSRIMMNLETIVGAYIRGQLVTCLLMAIFTFVLLNCVRRRERSGARGVRRSRRRAALHRPSPLGRAGVSRGTVAWARRCRSSFSSSCSRTKSSKAVCSFLESMAGRCAFPHPSSCSRSWWAER